MKQPRPLVALIGLTVLLGLAGFPAAAFDWGGDLDNSTTLTFYSNPFSLDVEQENRLAFWLEADFAAAGSLFAEASYTFALDRYMLFDLDALRYEARLFSILQLSAGRVEMRDFSGTVLADTLDGLHLAVNLPWSVISVYAGTSALRFLPSTTIVMSEDDAADVTQDALLDPGDVARLAALAPPRVFEGVEALFPELFLRQDLTVSVLLQQDLRTAARLSQGGRLFTEYYGIGLSGPILPALYYSLFGYLETGRVLSYAAGDGASFTETLIGGITGLRLSYYMRSVLSSRLSLEGIFASGDPDYAGYYVGAGSGSTSQFVPISQPTLALLFSPQLRNLVLTDLSYSLKPLAQSRKLWLRELQGELKVAAFLRPTAGPIPAAGLNRSSEALYLGTEIDATANYRPFSDLGLALTFGLFLPNGSAFTGEYAEPMYGGRFELSFSF